MGSVVRKKKKVTRGFTLVELLVVITIFVTVGSVVISLLVISLRGSNKSESTTVVKQNGSFALSQMVKNIRYARDIATPASCIPSATSSTLTIVTYPYNTQITYQCPIGASQAISSNSASLIDINAVQVTACQFTCVQASASEPPRVTIQFTLTSRGANALTESQSTIPFQSSVILRNAVQ